MVIDFHLKRELRASTILLTQILADLRADSWWTLCAHNFILCHNHISLLNWFTVHHHRPGMLRSRRKAKKKTVSARVCVYISLIPIVRNKASVRVKKKTLREKFKKPFGVVPAIAHSLLSLIQSSLYCVYWTRNGGRFDLFCPPEKRQGCPQAFFVLLL